MGFNTDPSKGTPLIDVSKTLPGASTNPNGVLNVNGARDANGNLLTPGITAPPAAPAPAPAPVAPAAPPTTTPAPGPNAPLSGPGSYEQWIKDNSGKFNDPTAIEALYNSGGSALNDPNINHVSNIGPGQFQTQSQGFVDALGSPGAAESLAGRLSTNGSSAQSVYANDTGALKTPSAAEDLGGTLPTSGSNSTSVYGQAAPALDDAGAMEAFYAAHGSDPNQKGYTESLYESGLGQLDPYYNYAEKRALGAAQTASAARGNFNSGLAVQQESDITGNLRGQQAKAWVDLAPQADAAKLSRETLGANEARSAQDSTQNRFSTLSGIASAGDAADQARENARITADKNASDAANARINTLSNAASAGDAADLGLTNARITADKNAEDAANTRAQTQANISSKAEDQALQEWLANAGLAGTKDQTALADEQQKYSEASAASKAKEGRILDQAGLMKDLQEEAQNRLTGGLNQTSKLSQEESDLVQKIYGDAAANTASNNALDATWLQAEADKYGITADEMKSIMGLQGTVLSAYATGGKSLVK